MYIFKSFIKNQRGLAGISVIELILFFSIMLNIIALYNSYMDYKMFGGNRYYTEKRYIVSLEDNLAFSNSKFVLGVGNINQDMYYLVRVIKSENPLITVVYKLNASEWNLIEKDNLDRPYLYRKIERSRDRVNGEIVEKAIEQYIVVPKGTIKKTFNIEPQ
ncbi:hypothetical protein SAMN04244560_00342 [Thermoanaerobacter thermohydrosulfuricus]|uniref:Uncharacterized protein n=1 Tax=Thermoanaerobacter thermohydrosulfuricus TaxID=1516 RepID=A0A1G7IVH1_THETY|nr:hypothetical protein [Thermoanaerobacter thermohydrosulfuricus]SDF16667.1 hypothetical protein SAMN04244560_00342 [Thermoanaerobacter thermohydrosulfuricus]